MRRRKGWAAAWLLLAGPACLALTADGPSPDAKAGPYRRLPGGFGQVGLNDLQREQVYEVRGRFRSEIVALTARIEELKHQEMAECEALLTDAQRRLLDAGRAASRSRATAKKATAAVGGP